MPNRKKSPDGLASDHLGRHPLGRNLKNLDSSAFESLMSIRHGDLSQNCKTKIMRGAGLLRKTLLL
jgi:hypothetical protein